MLAKIDDFSNRLFPQPNPNEPKCCFCFPMKCGIILIGLSAMIDTLQMVGDILILLKTSTLVAIFFMVACLGMVINVFLFIRYFVSDTGLTRKNLVTGCFIMMVANAFAYFGVIIGVIFVPEIKIHALLNLLPKYLFPILIWFYFRMICYQWAAIGIASGMS